VDTILPIYLFDVGIALRRIVTQNDFVIKIGIGLFCGYTWLLCGYIWFFCGYIGLVCKNVRLGWGCMRLFCGDIWLFCGDIRLFCGYSGSFLDQRWYGGEGVFFWVVGWEKKKKSVLNIYI